MVDVRHSQTLFHEHRSRSLPLTSHTNTHTQSSSQIYANKYLINEINYEHIWELVNISKLIS